MKESQSITNNLLLVDVLSNRVKHKTIFQSHSCKGLKEVFYENNNIFKRVSEIHNIAELLNKKTPKI